MVGGNLELTNCDRVKYLVRLKTLSIKLGFVYLQVEGVLRIKGVD